MNYNTEYVKIITDETFRESIKHGSDDFPFKFYYDNIELFDFNCIDWHWHGEFEFLFVEKGELEVDACDKHFILKQGQGLFINSKRLHRFYSSNCAIIPNFVFKPTLIADHNSDIYKKYIDPIINSSCDYYVFKQDEWHTNVLSIMNSINHNGNSNQLMIKSMVCHLWQILYDNLDVELQYDSNTSYSQALLILALDHIHKNFNCDITLDDIALKLSISKSSLLKLFNLHLSITPINYLINYRLKQASILLVNTEYSVNRIAKDVGFDNIGYFCKRFKKYFSVTPTQYRKKNK